MTAPIARAARGMALLMLTMAALLFGPARTFDYWQAWVFLALFLAAALAVSLYLMKYDPQLMQRRMRGGPAAETGWRQKAIMTVASVGFGAILVVPALDHRLHWSEVSTAWVLAGDAMFALGWVIIFFIFRANTYAAATVVVETGQTVVSSGPYAIVRHPMYAGSLLYFAGMPLALGSWCGLAVLAMILPALVARLLDEERVLRRDLPGYEEYQAKVPYRLLPGLW